VRVLRDGTNAPPKKRGKGITTDWRDGFLAALRNSANVRAACQKVGIDRRTAYRQRERDAEFAAQWDEAIQDACDILEAEAWTRARGGSDLLLIFLLKAHRPEKYRETSRYEVTGAQGKAIQIEDVEQVRRARWAEIMPTLTRLMTEGQKVTIIDQNTAAQGESEGRASDVIDAADSKENHRDDSAGRV